MKRGKLNSLFLFRRNLLKVSTEYPMSASTTSYGSFYLSFSPHFPLPHHYLLSHISCVEILGNFFLGALLACCFGLPLVLRHVDVIDDLGVALCILSIVILLGSGVAYGVHRARSEAFLGWACGSSSLHHYCHSSVSVYLYVYGLLYIYIHMHLT